MGSADPLPSVSVASRSICASRAVTMASVCFLSITVLVLYMRLMPTEAAIARMSAMALKRT